MISIIQMNIYIKLPRGFARAVLLPLLFRTLSKILVDEAASSPAFSPSPGNPPRPFLNEHADKTFHSTCQEFNSAMVGERESNEPEEEPNGTWTNRGRGMAFGESNLLFFSRSPLRGSLLLFLYVTRTHTSSVVWLPTRS